MDRSAHAPRGPRFTYARTTSARARRYVHDVPENKHMRTVSLAFSLLLGICSCEDNTAREPSVPPGSFVLSVTHDGPGLVASSPEGISCGDRCDQSWPSGTQVI